MSLPAGTLRGVPALDDVPSDERLPQQADIVVIGGGIIGAAATFFLAQSGHSVLLCEKGMIGAEQSSRNWGWVRQMGRDVSEMQLAMESLKLWRSLRGLGIETGFEETGITYVARRASDRAAFAEWEAQGRSHDVPVHLLRGGEVQELLPGLDGRFAEALHTANDGRAEPAMAAPALARAARKCGAAIVTGCAARGVETSAGRISAVVTEKGAVACDHVLLAGGAWSRLFLGNLGIRFPQLRVVGTAARIETAAGLPLMPVGGEDFAVRRRRDGGYTIARRNANVAPITPDSFAFFTDFFPTYLKTWRELKLRLNAQSLSETRIPRRWSLDAPSPFEATRVLDPDPDPAYVRGALANLGKAFPEARNARVTHAWAGVIDATPDAVPAIGPVPGWRGLYMASGFSGHGFGIGPGAGRLAADLISSGTPCVDPAPFAPSRFVRASRPVPTSAPELDEAS